MFVAYPKFYRVTNILHELKLSSFSTVMNKYKPGLDIQ